MRWILLMGIVYRMALADLGTSGLGSEIISDVFGTTGVFEGQAQLKWTEVLNGPGACEFSLPIDHASVTRANFAVGQREIHVYRDVDGAGEVLVWGGRLWTASQNDWGVRFIAKGWFQDLTRRQVNQDLHYVDEDQNDIIRDVIDTIQAEHSLGITHYDSSDSGTLKTLHICEEERKVVSDIIDEFVQEDDGVDFAILPDKKLRLWSPMHSSTPGVTFTDATNIVDVQYTTDASNVNTQVAATSEDECGPFVEYFVDSAAYSTYGQLEANLEGDIKNKNRMKAKARELLRNTKTPLTQITLTTISNLEDSPDLLSYELGDILSVETTRGATGGFGAMDVDYRLLDREVSFTNPEEESVKLTLDSVTS